MAASFTAAGAYSSRATPAVATAARTAPRTSPMRSALCTLRATKARSSTTTDGAQVSISRRHSAWSRARRSASEVPAPSVMVPLARCRSSGPALSTTPQPLTRDPGSIPSARTPPPPGPPPGSSTRPRASRRQLVQLLRRDVHVRRHALHVVVILERFQEAHHLLRLLPADRRRRRRHHRHLGRRRCDSRPLERLLHRLEPLGRAEH